MPTRPPIKSDVEAGRRFVAGQEAGAYHWLIGRVELAMLLPWSERAHVYIANFITLAGVHRTGTVGRSA